MKVFVDECVDWRLSRDIVGHEVKTARQMGWSTIKNGELLALAAKAFDVFVTVDRNLSFQQNLPAFSIAVIVLRAPSNRLADLKLLIPELLACIPSAKKGAVGYVGVQLQVERTGRQRRAIICQRAGPPFTKTSTNISSKIRSIHRFISRKLGVSGLRAWEAAIAQWRWKALTVSSGSGSAPTLTTLLG